MVIDFERLSKVLDISEGAFVSLMEKYNLPAYIERWRWDEPVITLTWLDFSDDYIYKNMHALIIIEGNEMIMEIEVNAWRDTDEEKKRVRYWKHEKVGQETLDESKPEKVLEPIKKLVFKGYSRVSKWSKEDLKNEHIISQKEDVLDIDKSNTLRSLPQFLNVFVKSRHSRESGNPESM